jgi:hypothetical protein
MATIYRLDRRFITGEFDYNTPTCVIKEVCETHGINLNRQEVKTDERINVMISDISKTQTMIVHSDGIDPTFNIPIFNNEKERSYIARYVSTDYSIRTWKYQQLMEAFMHLQLYSRQDSLPPLPDSKTWRSGPKTQEYPLSYDATILYRICRHYGVDTNKDMTLGELTQAVQFLTFETSQLRSQINDMVQNCTKGTLINMITVHCKYSGAASPLRSTTYEPMFIGAPVTLLETDDNLRYKSSNLTEDLLSPFINEFKDVKRKLLLRIIPDNHYEAIVLAALIFKINVTESQNPINEYQHAKKISLNTSGRNYYTPIDFSFRERYYKNGTWYNISRTWTPILHKLYNSNEIEDFLLREGYTYAQIENNNHYELLQMSRIEPNFYTGNHPDCKEETTPFSLEDIKDIDSHLILSYGIAGPDGKINLYSVEELTDLFNNRKSFQDPQNSSTSFAKIAIEKLKYICRQMTSSNYQNEIKSQFDQLLASIIAIENTAKFDNPVAIQLREKYLALNNEEKEKVESCFLKLLHASMYMRGWKIPGVNMYPLRSSDTHYSRNLYQDMVERQTAESIHEFKECTNQLHISIRDTIMYLPLMNFRSAINGDIEFYASTNSEVGMTIWDKIQIVSLGDDSDNINSCIRMSSNWLLATAYFYMMALRKPFTFNIREAQNIS